MKSYGKQAKYSKGGEMTTIYIIGIVLVLLIGIVLWLWYRRPKQRKIILPTINTIDMQRVSWDLDEDAYKTMSKWMQTRDK